MKLPPSIVAELERRGKVGPRAGKNMPADAQPSLVPGFLQKWVLVTGEACSAEREVMFHPTSRWRFDLAWPDKKVAVELHGGSWQQGRHQRGAGFTRDRQKMVAAIELGWRVLEFTDEDLRTRPVQVIEQIRKVLANVPERD